MIFCLSAIPPEKMDFVIQNVKQVYFSIEIIDIFLIIQRNLYNYIYSNV